jgi:hypothetical protein
MVSHLRRLRYKTVSFVEVTDIGQKKQMQLNTTGQKTDTYKQLLYHSGRTPECTWVSASPVQEISILHLVQYTEKKSTFHRMHLHCLF